MNPAATMMARPSSSPTRNCRFLGIGEKPSRSIYRYFTSNAAGGPVRNSETGRPRTQLLLEPAARGERLRAKPPAPAVQRGPARRTRPTRRDARPNAGASLDRRRADPRCTARLPRDKPTLNVLGREREQLDQRERDEQAHHAPHHGAGHGFPLALIELLSLAAKYV